MERFMLIISVLFMVQLAWSSKDRKGMFRQSREEFKQNIQRALENPDQRDVELSELMTRVSNMPLVEPNGIKKKKEAALMGSGEISTDVYVSNWYHKKCTRLGPDTPNPCAAGFVYNKCLRSCYIVFKRAFIFDDDLQNRTWESSLYGCSGGSSIDTAFLYFGGGKGKGLIPSTLRLPTLLPHGVHIQSQAEQSFVDYLIRLYDGEDQDFWLGGLNGQEWIALSDFSFMGPGDIASTNITGYTNWATGYPDMGECMYMDSDDNYKWKVTDDCESDKAFVCEIEAEYILDTPLIGYSSGPSFPGRK